MNLFKKKPKSRKYSEMSDGELHSEYKKLAEQYDTNRTEENANKLNEIVIVWKNRERQEKNLPEEKHYKPEINVEVPEEPPLEVQQAMYEIDPMAGPRHEIKTQIDDKTEQTMNRMTNTEENQGKKTRQGHLEIPMTKEEKPASDSIDMKNNDKTHQPVLAEKPEKTNQVNKKKAIFSLFQRKRQEQKYCIKCKHDAKHHIRKDGKSEGCKICGCLKTIQEIDAQEEITKCPRCDEAVYIIESEVYEDKSYHKKCFDMLQWDLAKQRRNEKKEQ